MTDDLTGRGQLSPAEVLALRGRVRLDPPERCWAALPEATTILEPLGEVMPDAGGSVVPVAVEDRDAVAPVRVVNNRGEVRPVVAGRVELPGRDERTVWRAYAAVPGEHRSEGTIELDRTWLVDVALTWLVSTVDEVVRREVRTVHGDLARLFRPTLHRHLDGVEGPLSHLATTMLERELEAQAARLGLRCEVVVRARLVGDPMTGHRSTALDDEPPEPLSGQLAEVVRLRDNGRDPAHISRALGIPVDEVTHILAAFPVPAPHRSAATHTPPRSR